MENSELRKGLFVVPADFEQLKRKGVEHLIYERDESGYLDKCITIHMFSQQTRKLDFGEKHTVYEISPYSLLGSNGFIFIRYFFIILYLLRLVYRIRKVAKTEKVDFIRAQDPYLCGVVAWLAAKTMSSMPVCVSIHSDYDVRFRLDGAKGAPVFLGSRTLARKLESFVYRHVDFVLPIRESLAEKAIQMGAPRERVRLFPHTADLTAFLLLGRGIDIRELYGISKKRFIVSFAGRMSEENYLSDLLDIVRQVCHAREDVDFVVAGDGGDKQKFDLELVSEGLTNRVHTLGFVERKIVSALRQQSDINLCLMGGYSLIEACSAAKPVITYDIEWHSELVKHNKSGFVIPEHDVVSVCNAIRTLIDDEALAKRLGQQSGVLAFSKHDVQAVIPLRRRIYSEIIATNSKEV